jgi:hypothetical protein
MLEGPGNGPVESRKQGLKNIFKSFVILMRLANTSETGGRDGHTHQKRYHDRFNPGRLWRRWCRYSRTDQASFTQCGDRILYCSTGRCCTAQYDYHRPVTGKR